MPNNKDKKATGFIAILSLVVVGLVALLYWGPKFTMEGDYSFLPAMNATINGLTAIVLLAGRSAIKKGNQDLHRKLMISALSLSILFLVGYIIHHAVTPQTTFGGEGWIRPVYFILLISHILLAAGMVPLVLMTIYRAFNKDFVKHKKIARITFPIWLYVSVTGVIVYFMISPYYT